MQTTSTSEQMDTRAPGYRPTLLLGHRKRAKIKVPHNRYPMNRFLVHGDPTRSHPETAGRNAPEEHRHTAGQREREVRATRGLLPDIRSGYGWHGLARFLGMRFWKSSDEPPVARSDLRCTPRAGSYAMSAVTQCANNWRSRRPWDSQPVSRHKCACACLKAQTGPGRAAAFGNGSSKFLPSARNHSSTLRSSESLNGSMIARRKSLSPMCRRHCGRLRIVLR